MKSNLPNLLRKRKLIAEIVRFRLKSSAVDNRLGYLWWLIDPIIMVIIYWFVFSVIRSTHNYSPYPVFIGCAVVSWKFFTRCFSNGIRIFKAHGATMRSIPFPTAVLPIALVAEEGVLFGFGLTALLLAAAGMGVHPTLYALQLIPLVIIQSAMMLGITLLIACLGALIYDLSIYVNHVIMFLFYLSPSLYGLDLLEKHFAGSPWIVDVYMFINPFAILFTSYRHAIWSHQMIPPWWWGVMCLHTGLLLFTGYRIYQLLDRRLLKASAA